LLLPLSILLLLNATTATAISTLSLRDALPISGRHRSHRALLCPAIGRAHDGRCSHRLRLSHIAGEFSHIRCRRAEYDFLRRPDLDRKSTRLNSSHVKISYAVFCLKKKKNTTLS